MTTYQLQPITDETLAHLPESKYHRMGGWLVFFVYTLVLQGVNFLSAGALLASGLVRRASPLTAAIALLLSLYFIPAALVAVTLTLLFCRKIAFRIPFTAYALFVIVFAAFNIIENPGDTIPAYAILALMFAAWIVYTFTSDRVRVFCNRQPKRPVPMPAPEAEQARWDASGTVYTDANGQIVDFSGTSARQKYRFTNMPSGWTQPSSSAQYKEE